MTKFRTIAVLLMMSLALLSGDGAKAQRAAA